MKTINEKNNSEQNKDSKVNDIPEHDIPKQNSNENNDLSNVNDLDNKNIKPKPTESERKENLVAFIVFAVLVLLAVGLFTDGFGLLNKKTDYGERITVPIGNDPFIGNRTAKVIIIAFSDYSCPFCKKGEETMKTIQEKYKADLLYIFKDNPLTSIHPDSYNASLAAECAKEQDKYWEYHDYLFAHNDQLEIQYLKEYAQILELDSEKFNACFESQRYKSEVNLDMQVAAQVGVTGTPTFFINGIKMVGALPESEFAKVIDSELGK